MTAHSGRGPSADESRTGVAHPSIHGRRTLALRAFAAKTADLLSGGHHIRIPWDPPPTSPQPRYGYGLPSHARLTQILSRADDSYRKTLEEFSHYAPELEAIPLDAEDSGEPHWRNELLFGLDGVSLYGFVRLLQPRSYVEVGSGNSTLFVARARKDGGLDFPIASVDPEPRREVDALCETVVRERLERADLSVFERLRPGDILFMDGTHRVFMHSDVTVFFMDVLPELPAGVLVGIHDIHLPDDYRPEHNDRFYSEQYMLAAYLLAESPWLETVLPCWYVSHHPSLAGPAKALIPAPFCEEEPHGVIFWLRTRARPA